MTDPTRGDELLQRNDGRPESERRQSDAVLRSEEWWLAKRAYIAGYLAAKPEVRRDNRLVQRVAERKFKTWWRGR